MNHRILEYYFLAGCRQLGWWGSNKELLSQRTVCHHVNFFLTTESILARKKRKRKERDVIVIECLSAEKSKRTILGFAKISIAR